MNEDGDDQPIRAHSWLEAGVESSSSWAPPPAGAPSSRAPAGGSAAAETVPASASAPAAPAPVPARVDSGYEPGPTAPIGWITDGQPGPRPAERDRPPRRPMPGLLLVAGAALVVFGSNLTWGSFPSSAQTSGLPPTFDGFTDLVGESKDGPFFAAFATLLAGCGVTSLLVRRAAAVFLPGMVLAAFGAAAATIDLVDVVNPESSAVEATAGPGLPTVIAGFVLALGGCVAGRRTRGARGGP